MFPSQCRGNISKDHKTVVTETCSAAELSKHNRAECREVPGMVCKNQKLLGGGGAEPSRLLNSTNGEGDVLRAATFSSWSGIC